MGVRFIAVENEDYIYVGARNKVRTAVNFFEKLKYALTNYLQDITDGGNDVQGK